jgi:hypothetical protein
MANPQSKFVYPALPPGLETRFEAILLASKGSRGYLDDPQCPYAPEMKRFLRLILAPARAERAKDSGEAANAVGLDANADKFDKMLAEIADTIDEMSSIEADLSDGEASDRIQFVKAKTILLEKWVNIKEKIYNVREIAEFQAIIIRILDGVLSKDQRQAFIDALRELRTTVKAADELSATNDEQQEAI